MSFLSAYRYMCRRIGITFISGVGFRVARSTVPGNARASKCGTSDGENSHAFLYMYVNINFLFSCLWVFAGLLQTERNMETLRKVTFKLVQEGMTVGSFFDEETCNFALKQRHGAVIGECQNILFDREMNRYVKRNFTVVKEDVTGFIYQVNPQQINYVE